MNVTASTLPRRSVRTTRSPVSAVSANCGAFPTTGNRAFSMVACAHATGTLACIIASMSAGRSDGRPTTSGLEFPLELIEHAPVRSLTDELLRWTLDHAGFAQAQRVEPDRLLGVVVAPVAVRQLAQRLPRVLG